MKKKIIKTEEQAMIFVRDSFTTYLNKCSKVVNDDLVCEWTLFLIARLFCEQYGRECLDKIFQEVKLIEDFEQDHSPEKGSKNKYH